MTAGLHRVALDEHGHVDHRDVRTRRILLKVAVQLSLGASSSSWPLTPPAEKGHAIDVADLVQAAGDDVLRPLDERPHRTRPSTPTAKTQSEPNASSYAASSTTMSSDHDPRPLPAPSQCVEAGQ